MADGYLNVDEHQFFVDMTNHVRPNNTEEEIRFPVIDQDTVDRAKQFADNGFSLHCEYLGSVMWAFYITDDVADYDVRTKIIPSVEGDYGETNRKNVSHFIKSDSVEQLLAQREIYIRNQENEHDQ